jgi:hypothetical protein
VENRLREVLRGAVGVVDERAKQLTRQAAKLRATTPAGIFAKALVVRSSHTGAAVLAMSLADELIACPGLRQSLWPAETAGCSAASRASTIPLTETCCHPATPNDKLACAPHLSGAALKTACYGPFRK